MKSLLLKPIEREILFCCVENDLESNKDYLNNIKDLKEITHFKRLIKEQIEVLKKLK